jgi:hypothetical protein
MVHGLLARLTGSQALLLGNPVLEAPAFSRQAGAYRIPFLEIGNEPTLQKL